MAEHGLARIQVAATLGRMREQAGITRDQAAEALYCTTAKIGDIERGRSGVKRLDLEKLLDLYGVQGTDREELETAAQSSRRRRRGRDEPVFSSRDQRLVDLEAQARSVTFYSAEVVPGFTQTQGYARALLEAGGFLTADEVDSRLAARVARHRAMRRTEPTPAGYWCILGEAALRANVGGPDVMAEQLDALLDWTSGGGDAVVQVLPLGSGAHDLLGFTVTLLRFDPPAGDFLYSDVFGRGVFSDGSNEIEMATRVFDRLKAKALDLEPSREIIRGVLREYREEAGRAPLERVVRPATDVSGRQLRRDTPDP